MNNKTKHYIRLDVDNKFIIKTFSTAFEQPLDGDICVNEDGGRHFNLALYNMDMSPLLKWDASTKEIVETTKDDIEVWQKKRLKSKMTMGKRVLSKLTQIKMLGKK